MPFITADYETLRREILTFIEQGCDKSRPERFNQLALRAFQFQYETNEFYRSFAKEFTNEPVTLKSWEEIPCLPVSAFKQTYVATFPAREQQLVFRTSGTSMQRRGVLPVKDISLYRISLLSGFKHFCLFDRSRIKMSSLIPSLKVRPDSSLSYMITTLFEVYGDRESHWFFEHAQPDFPGLIQFCYRAVAAQEPVMLFGTALAMLAFVEYCEAERVSFVLPPGSRVMETGGGKGRQRSISRAGLHDRIFEIAGIPQTHCINEYGMTELASQFYDSAFLNSPGKQVTHEKLSPPWAAVRVIHPETGHEVSEGEQGMLCHVDLASLDTVIALETEDIGIRTKNGFEIVDRIWSAPQRGCSLAAEDALYV